jgi:hypothetical protein
MNYDDDFPARAPDYSREREAAAIERGLHFLDACASVSPSGASWAAYDWLQMNEAGLPRLPLIDGPIRDEARFWAETATPPELECYGLAAMDRLAGIGGGQALFASRQIKRLAGALFRRMSPTEQAAFTKWINEQGGVQ